MNIQSQIENLLIPILGEEYFVVEVSYIQRKPNPRLTIILDGDKGIAVDKCAEVSREISAILDELDLIPTSFNLEVTSPGVDKPLLLERQYHQHIGRKLKLEMKDGQNYTGKLLAVQTGQINFQPEKNPKTPKNGLTSELQLSITDIQKAVVLVSFH
jgi:ribosome maturation factor RimP